MSSASTTQPSTQFSILGPVRVWHGSAELARGTQRQQTMLALLLAHAGEPVSTTELIAALWPQSPPEYALNVVHRQVGTLRRLLEPQLEARAEGKWIRRDGASYRFTGPTTSLDLLLFRDLARQAHEALAASAPDRAVAGYLGALALWRDFCGSGLEGLATVHPAFAGVDNEVIAVATEAADLVLMTSTAHRLVPSLQRIADRNPLNEGLQSRLLLSLAATGRRAEALARYAAVHERLNEELGVGPGRELIEAHRQILRPEPDPRGLEPSTASPTTVSPAQLPADLPVFVGRESYLAKIEAIVAENIAATRPALVVAIDGMPGVGKTTTAIRLAHRLSRHFPDGCVFVNLRGLENADLVVPPTTAIRVLLNSLGVHDSAMPAAHDARVGLFRSLLATRRVLLVLDNARDADHVADLIPGSPGSAAIVTSRARLGGLVMHGACAVTLDVMTFDEARAAFVDRWGPHYSAAEREAIDELVEYCGQLPLALSIVAAKAADNPQITLTALARELRELRGGLDGFTSDETQMDLREIFSWSYASLDDQAARLFRLLALHGGAEISLSAAASLAGRPVRETRRQLAVLLRNRLLQEVAPERFAFHDLLHAYAAELAQAPQTRAETVAAGARLVNYFQASAYSASVRLVPAWIPDEAPALLPGVLDEPIRNFESAMRWFMDEGDTLDHIIRRCAAGELTGQAWRLAMCVMPYWDQSGSRSEWAAAAQTLVDNAEASGDQEALAHGLRIMGGVLSRDGLLVEARAVLQRARDIWDELGRPEQQGYLWQNFGQLSWKAGDPDQAFDDYAKALHLFEQFGRRKGAANAIFGQALCELSRGRFMSGLSLVERAEGVFEQLGDPHGTAICLLTKAEAAYLQSRYDEAFVLHKRAAHWLAGQRWPDLWYNHLASLGAVHEAVGDLPEAVRCWAQAVHYLDEYRLRDPENIRERLSAATNKR